MSIAAYAKLTLTQRNGKSFIRLNNVNQSNSVRGVTGTHLTGTVYGMDKDLTTWVSPYYNDTKEFSCLPNNVSTLHNAIYSTDPLSQAITIFNINSNNNTQLCMIYIVLNILVTL